MENIDNLEMKSNKELQTILSQTEAEYQNIQAQAQEKGKELQALMTKMEELSKLYNRTDDIYQQRMGKRPITSTQQ